MWGEYGDLKEISKQLKGCLGVGRVIQAEKGADVVSVDLSRRSWKWQQPYPTFASLFSFNSKNRFSVGNRSSLLRNWLQGRSY
jgi:hypothetical protein